MACANEMTEVFAWVTFITTSLTDDANELKSEYPAIFSDIDVHNIINSLNNQIAIACKSGHMTATNSQSNRSSLSKLLETNEIDDDSIDSCKEIYRHVMPILTAGICVVADSITNETERLFLNTMNYKCGFLYFSCSEIAAAKVRMQKLSDKTEE